MSLTKTEKAARTYLVDLISEVDNLLQSGEEPVRLLELLGETITRLTQHYSACKAEHDSNIRCTLPVQWYCKTGEGKRMLYKSLDRCLQRGVPEALGEYSVYVKDANGDRLVVGKVSVANRGKTFLFDTPQLNAFFSEDVD